MSEKIVLVAAYPKAGNTWIRAIIRELVRSDLADQEALPTLESGRWIDAPLHDVLGTQAKICKTHCRPTHGAFREAARQKPYEIAGVVSIRRHPLDVLLSQLNFAFIKRWDSYFIGGVRKEVASIIADGEIDLYIDRFLEVGGCPEYLKRCGSYEGFYEGWERRAEDIPHLHLRYEEMIRDPLTGIRNITNFLDLDHDEETVARKVEERSQLDGKFFWRKRAYNHRELLREESVRRFEVGFSDQLTNLGYS